MFGNHMFYSQSHIKKYVNILIHTYLLDPALFPFLLHFFTGSEMQLCFKIIFIKKRGEKILFFTLTPSLSEGYTSKNVLTLVLHGGFDASISSFTFQVPLRQIQGHVF